MNQKDTYIKSLAEIKSYIFSYRFNELPYLHDFKGNPYSYIKSLYYMHSSVFLVYFLLRTRITPNMVTVIYIFAGIATGVLLAIPNIYCNLVAVFIAFNKGTLDWSDGFLARIKYETTLTGHILDEYGATINSIGLSIGLGFYSMHQSGFTFLIYIIPIVPFLYGAKFMSIGKVIILNNINNLLLDKTNSKKNLGIEVLNDSNDNLDKYPSTLTRLSNVLDDRARSVDFILLIVLLDYYFNMYFTFYLFMLILIKLSFQFILSLYYGINQKWAESLIDNIKY
jgi:hypothetical protein